MILYLRIGLNGPGTIITDMTAFLFCIFVQLLPTLGSIMLFGFLIAFCKKIFYNNCGDHAHIAVYATGLIGTPIHELSHALFCVIFGHKIHKIKLFQMNSDDGVLGYVQHSYNPKNIYQRIGNFFIGIAPILVISSILYLLARILVPDLLEIISAKASEIDPLKGLVSMFSGIGGIVGAVILFSREIMWWVFIIVSAFLALHMTLSGADINGAKDGILFFVLTVVGANGILAIVDMELLFNLTKIVMTMAGMLNLFLIISLIISTMLVVGSFVIKAGVKKIKIKK